MSTPHAPSDAPIDETPAAGRRARRTRRPAAGTPAAAARSRRRSKHRRRLVNVAGLMAGLILTGALYSTISPANAAGDTPSNASSAVAAGESIYNRSCITCHGDNLQGVPRRGPSLIGVGAAAVYFQVHTGRMPLVRQDAEAQDRPPVLNATQTEQLMAYVQAHGGGPELPSGDLRDGDIAEGGELFRLNCASCHNFVGDGGALSSGKAAPALLNADDMTVYTAMLTGPENMPVFGDNQLTPDQKRAVVNYVQSIKTQVNPGGTGLGRLGPVPEGLVIWVVGIGVLMFGIFWMGSKA